ncbi:MAG: hypothetical protein JXB17_12440 [Bacteroidales bacterium]|nr:hypothetical protein [Bacteroidales bacterium]
MKKIIILLLFTFEFLFLNNSFSQDELKKFELTGYVSDMTSYLKLDLMNSEYLDHIVHNRLNFNWYPTNTISGSLQIRNQFLIGDQIRVDTANLKKEELKNDFLSVNIIEDKIFVLNSMIDRLYLNYNFNKVEFTLGRQRINWGQTYVFNSNDIFNAYSFFDFDYPERPGSDALRVQYYPSYTSTIEAAVKYENDSSITAGGLFRFSRWNYDIQIIGGLYNSKEYVAGCGWMGHIKNVSFSGELSYFYPKDNFNDTSGLFYTSINLNYMFSNSLVIQTEFFYNQYSGKYNLTFADLMNDNMDIKTLSISEFTFFTGLSYPINPLINSSINFMYYPDQKGIALYPSFDFSISEKSSFSLIGMYFTGEFDYTLIGKKRDNLYLGFLRYKYNF